MDTQIIEAIDFIKAIFNSKTFKKSIHKTGEYRRVVTKPIFGSDKFVANIDSLIQEMTPDNITYHYGYNLEPMLNRGTIIIRAYTN